MPGVRLELSRYFLKLVPKRAINWKKQIDRINEYCEFQMDRHPNLIKPTRFSDKIQWQKLFGASKIYTKLSDKIAVRTYVAEKGFASILVPQLWVGTDATLIPFDSLPRPFVLKSTHASGHVIMVQKDQLIDADKIAREAQGWLSHCHGTTLNEPGYIGVPRRLVVEQFLVCSNGEPPTELKFFVFDGVARFLQYVSITRQRVHTSTFLDRSWRQYPWRGKSPLIDSPPKPSAFQRALTAAECLGKGMDHCRVDFYMKDDSFYFGEITLYSFSGAVKLQPDDADFTMGSFWNLRWPKTRAVIAMISRDWGRM